MIFSLVLYLCTFFQILSLIEEIYKLFFQADLALFNEDHTVRAGSLINIHLITWSQMPGYFNRSGLSGRKTVNLY